MKRKRILCILLAALLLAAIFPMSAAADDPVQDPQPSAQPTGNGRIRLELRDGNEVIPEYTVALYKVADYNGQDITLTSDFAATNLTLEAIVEGQRDGTTSETLKTFLEQHSDLTPAYTKASDTGGIVEFTAMPNGLYYVCGQPDEDVEHSYARKVTMTPFLVALPTMDKDTQTFIVDEDTQGYKAIVDCDPKCEIEHLKAPLKIVKHVLKWETAEGVVSGSEVTFVFSVRVTWKDFQDPTVTHTYSNVAAITFDGPGTKEYTMPEQFPVGAVAEVQEIYPIPTGNDGDYYLVSGPIWNEPDQKILLYIEGDQQYNTITTVEFSNTYNGGGNSGNGYLNESTYHQPDPDQPGTWTWTQVR